MVVSTRLAQGRTEVLLGVDDKLGCVMKRKGKRLIGKQ